MQEGPVLELPLSSSGGTSKKLASKKPLKSFQAEVECGPGEVNRILPQECKCQSKFMAMMQGKGATHTLHPAGKACREAL